MKNGDHESSARQISTLRNVIELSSCFVVLLTLGQSSALATDKCGAVCDETWTVAGSPYVVTCDVNVATGCTLTIDAEVEIRFQSGTGLQISGTLDVNGSSGNEVTFTSDAASPAAGDWQGLHLRASATATVIGAIIQFAYIGVTVDGNSDVALTDSTVTYSGDDGIQTQGTSSPSLTLTEVTLSQNGNDGLRTYGFGTPTVFMDNVSAINNQRFGITLARGASASLTGVTASGNWDGMWVQGDYAVPVVVNVTQSSFTDNSRHGLYVYTHSTTDPKVTITASSIHSNQGSYDFVADRFLNPENEIIWLPDNWWGTTRTDQIAERIYDHEDSFSSPVVHFHAFASDCEIALGRDTDGDRLADFEDNCALDRNFAQADTDGDGMGDDCDPDPGVPPAGTCDGINDIFDGYADADADGWGDPCDFHPARDDCFPGAPEVCDGRDNNGDGLFASGELTDEDLDGAIACGDCDTFVDEADSECEEHPYCVVLSSGRHDPSLMVEKGPCGGAEVFGPCDVIQGDVEQLQFATGSVDLGQVVCVVDDSVWDRVTDLSPDRNPTCNTETEIFYLAKYGADSHYGMSSNDEPRDTMTPVCP